MTDITTQRLLALEARVIALESETWDLKRRLAAAEGWQAQTDAAWTDFPGALRRAFAEDLRDA